jgi:hypothetical protein
MIMTDWSKLNWCKVCQKYREAKPGVVRCHECHRLLRLKPQNATSKRLRDERRDKLVYY